MTNKEESGFGWTPLLLAAKYQFLKLSGLFQKNTCFSKVKACINQLCDYRSGRPSSMVHSPMGSAARAERDSFLNHYEGKSGFREFHISEKNIGASLSIYRKRA
jgi:hypothetical protein